MPRFVLLEHVDSPRTPGRVHWDLLFETGPVLRSWELAAPPKDAVEIEAAELPDHRPLYLDFEGELTAGRGTVRRVAHGEYEAIETGAQRWVVRLESPELQGTLTLIRLAAPAHRWRASLCAS